MNTTNTTNTTTSQHLRGQYLRALFAKALRNPGHMGVWRYGVREFRLGVDGHTFETRTKMDRNYYEYMSEWEIVPLSGGVMKG